MPAHQESWEGNERNRNANLDRLFNESADGNLSHPAVLELPRHATLDDRRAGKAAPRIEGVPTL